jgi:single-strand DNA-binding protein
MCEIKGKLIVIKNEEIVGTSNFKKRVFVLESQEQYPQSIQLELHQDRVDLIDPYDLGDEVMVSINIRGKAYDKPLEKTKYFNTLVAWKIQKL